MTLPHEAQDEALRRIARDTATTIVETLFNYKGDDEDVTAVIRQDVAFAAERIEEAIEAGAEWQRAQAPAGWQLVPEEPTTAMYKAALEFALAHMKEHGVDHLSPFEDYPPLRGTTFGMYRAMLAASPPPPVSAPSTGFDPEELRKVLEPLAGNANYYKPEVPYYEFVRVPLQYLRAAAEFYRTLFGKDAVWPLQEKVCPTCPECGGGGIVHPDGGWFNCPDCGGTGKKEAIL